MMLICGLVLQYEFVIPGEDKKWMVMWDYNIGLVRTTHLFKCQDYSKVGEQLSIYISFN